MVRFQKCMHCGENAIASIGIDRIPLCSVHYGIVLAGVTKLANKFGDSIVEIMSKLEKTGEM